MKKYWFEIKCAALLLFCIGGFLLALAGYGRYRIIYHNHHSAISSAISFYGFLLIVPYIVVAIYENFFRKESPKTKAEPANVLRENMEVMEIELKKSVVGISEYSEEIPGLSRAYKEIFAVRESDMPKPVLHHECVVHFKIKIGSKNYRRAEVFPFSEENTKICIAMNPATKVYYPKDAPENFTIDLSFINQYL